MAPTRLVEIYNVSEDNSLDGIRILETLKIKQARGQTSPPPYAILSHRWHDNELTLHDLQWEQSDEETNEKTNHIKAKLRRRQKVSTKGCSALKIIGACRTAQAYSHVEHLWIDSICIDKTNPAELSESINSMFRWYQEAAVCIVYLHDFYKKGRDDPSAVTEISKCDWFKRGWTLQELVAPKSVIFYDANWEKLGTRADLAGKIQEITGIAKSILLNPQDAWKKSVVHRMSWAAKRVTTKEEDLAYCLMGIFDVSMPVLYGEGATKAFRRLQKEIIQENPDQSIFAWKGDPTSGYDVGVLAQSPKCFEHTGQFHPSRVVQPFHMTNAGLSIELPLQQYPGRSNVFIAALESHDGDRQARIALQRLSSHPARFIRVDVHQLPNVSGGAGKLQHIFVQ